MLRAAVALGLVVACALCACAQQETEIRTWIMPRSCAVFRMPLPEGGLRFALVPSQPETTYRVSGIASGCLRHQGGLCQQVADASKTACFTATDKASTIGLLEGQLKAVRAGAEGYVYAYNPQFYPVLADMLVLVKPATAGGSRYRRLLQGGAAIAFGSGRALGARRLLGRHGGDFGGDFGGFFGGHHGGGRRANCTNGTRSGASDGNNGPSVDDGPDDNGGDGRNSTASAGAANSTGGSNSTSPATADLLNPNTGNTTNTTASTASNLIDQAANNYTGVTRTWVKVAIIVAIVLVSLAILAMLFCLARCLCMPRRAAAVPAGKQFIDT